MLFTPEVLRRAPRQRECDPEHNGANAFAVLACGRRDDTARAMNLRLAMQTTNKGVAGTGLGEYKHGPN